MTPIQQRHRSRLMQGSLILLTWLFALPSLTLADMADCAEAVTQQEINACARSRAEHLDTDLQIHLATIMQELPPAERQWLASEQQGWLQQRDQQCHGEARRDLGLTPGESAPSLYSQTYAGCLQQQTNQRITTLEMRLANGHLIGQTGPETTSICQTINIPESWDRREMPPRQLREKIFACAGIDSDVRELDELDRDFLFIKAQQYHLAKLAGCETQTSQPMRYDQLLPLGKLERLRRLTKQAAQGKTKIEPLPVIRFAFDNYRVEESEKLKLKTIVRRLQQNPNLRLQIEGHTDERNSDQYNLALGEQLAQSVKKYLVQAGVAQERMQTISYGEQMPVATNPNEAAWQQNRRVEFSFK